MVLSLLVTGLTIILSVIFVNIKKSRRNIFQPFNIVAGVCFLVQVYAPMIWVLEGREGWLHFPVLQHLNRANLYFLFGFLAYWLGYFVKQKKAANRSKWMIKGQPDSSRLVKYSWYAYSVSLALYLVYLGMRGRSVLSQLTLGQLGVYGIDTILEQHKLGTALWFMAKFQDSLICAAVLVLVFEKKHKILSTLAYVVALLLTVTAGWRALMMVIILAPIIYHYMDKHKNPKPWAVILVIVILFIFAGYIGAMRDVYRSGVGELQAFDFTKVHKAFMVNIEVFHSYFTMIGFIPQDYPYAYGLSYIFPVVMLIPRALWPGKPLQPNLKMLYAMYGDAARNGPAAPVWAEFYHNFGLIGIIAGMFLFGYVTKRIYIRSMGGDSLTKAGYALFIPYLFQYMTRGDASGILVGVIFLFGPIFLIRRLALGAGRNRESSLLDPNGHSTGKYSYER